MAAKLRKIEEVRRKDSVAYRVNLALPGAARANYSTFEDRDEAGKALAEINSQILKKHASKATDLATTRVKTDTAWDLFNKERLSKLDPDTQKSYKTAMARVLGTVEFLDAINKAWIDAELSGDDLRKATAWKYYTNWQTFLNWCKNKGFKVSNDYDKWDIDSYTAVKRKQKGWFTHDQFKAVIAELDKKTPYMSFMCKITGYFGLRIDEAITMKRNQIDAVSGIMTVYGKGDEEDGKSVRTVPIGVELAKQILDKSAELYTKHQKIMTDESMMFLEERKGSELVYSTVVKRWIAAITKIKLDHHLYTTHALRRYSYLYLHDLGVDYEAIKQIVGHNSDAYEKYIGNITTQLTQFTGKIKL
jgi:integrase